MINTVSAVIASGLSISLSDGTTLIGYTRGTVQMMFEVSAFDVQSAAFGNAALAALLSRSGVAEQLIVNVGIWSGSVIVQVTYADTNGAGNKMRTALAAGLVEATYEGVPYSAVFASGNSTTPTPAPTQAPTAPTASPTAPTSAPTYAPTAPTATPTRAPTAPARDVPFSASNPGMELNKVKLMVAAGAAIIVSGSVFLVLMATTVRLYLYGHKGEAMAMRFIDYDAEICDPSMTSPTPLSPLSRDRRGRADKTAARNRMNSYGAVESSKPTVATTIFGSNGDYITLEGAGGSSGISNSRDAIYGGIEIPSDDEEPEFGSI